MDGKGPVVDAVRCGSWVPWLVSYWRYGFSMVAALCGRVALSRNALAMPFVVL